MKRVSRFLFFLVLFVVACAAPTKKQEHSFKQEFKKKCPLPGWWDEVSIKGVKISSYEDLQKYWQNKDRSNRQFFKAAYQAILDHPEDEHLVVNALYLMPSGDVTYPQRQSLFEFAVERYFSYRRPLDHYQGKAGDTIAGIVRDLSYIYNKGGEYSKSLNIIERLKRERGAEVNHQMLELISLNHAESLYALGKREKAKAVLQRAISEYHGDWEKSLQERLAEYNIPK